MRSVEVSRTNSSNSADSENSDPIRPALLKTDSTSSSSLGTLERKSRMIGARYRTDSETTDEQCIPESISEAHDSAVDDVDDSDIADDRDTDNDKSPNCDFSVNVPPLPINLVFSSRFEMN